MPTKRFWVFAVIAVALYFLANQTQVGWIYLISNALVGLLIITWVYAWGSLKRVKIERHVARDDGPNISDDSTFHEDDQISVTLRFSNTRLKPVFLLQGEETCPYAPPDDQNLPLFIPSLFKNQAITLSYQTECYLRGLYTQAGIPLHSNGPFGFFKTRYTANVLSELLIFPSYYPLKRLRAYERLAFAEQRLVKIGPGSQVVGTREYRPGDSPRHIHWRSTARTNKLVVKEFSDDEQISLAVVLDLSTNGNVGQGKFSTFEVAIRIAASLSYFAQKQKIPIQLFGASKTFAPPPLPLGWWGSLNYLAKVKNEGDTPLPDLLKTLPPLPFVIVLVSHPTAETASALTALRKKGSHILAIYITPNGKIEPALLPPKDNQLQTIAVDPYHWAESISEL